ncbi:MAG: bifunctional folylpolyglutamate synthase/dihydrofolate synthase [Candidatus Omnitrophica bacterium]|nr:bifunctional folylpolyglutamate synthase/dihydrofolate synthase [Candidatus Omnitrophota bacterium]
MRLLLKCFRNPHKAFFPILIAGTKGKGSTGFFLESILREAHYRVGFYSSPHLEDPRERIRLNGNNVSKSRWAKALTTIRRGLCRLQLDPRWGDFTYFEIMTLLAMLLFKQARMEIGIFEVGMGGRLDATNVIDAKVVGLTPIHLDHEFFLGNTITRIAREKTAIIRRGAQVVVGPQTAEAMRVIRRAIRCQKARLWPALSLFNYRIGLSGDFQKVNAGVAFQIARVLRDIYHYSIEAAAFRKGLEADEWPGRFEFLKGHPEFLLDGAHNPISIEALVRNLMKIYPRRNCLLVFGVSRDKKSDRMLKTLSRYFKDCILTTLPNPRSQEIGVLLSQAQGYFRRIIPTGSIPEAVGTVRKIASSDCLVVVTGSFYLIGEVRKWLRTKSW